MNRLILCASEMNCLFLSVALNGPENGTLRIQVNISKELQRGER